MLSKGTGVELLHVPFNGSAPIKTRLSGARSRPRSIPCRTCRAASRRQDPGALGVSGAQRRAQLPEVPTFVEQGLRDIAGLGWFGSTRRQVAQAAHRQTQSRLSRRWRCRRARKSCWLLGSNRPARRWRNSPASWRRCRALGPGDPRPRDSRPTRLSVAIRNLLFIMCDQLAR